MAFLPLPQEEAMVLYTFPPPSVGRVNSSGCISLSLAAFSSLS